MQILFEYGDEHGLVTKGLGLLPGGVTRIEAPVVPHMGWNTVSAPSGSVLFSGLDGDTRFYFVHSYAAHLGPPLSSALVTTTVHGGRFVSALESGVLAATQFHPEKSGDAGAALLRNWLRTLPATG
jgi:glutamine amidotransferase